MVSLVREITKFGGVGVVGFSLDTGLTLTFVFVGWPVLLAKLLAVLVAILTTLFLNNLFVFKGGLRGLSGAGFYFLAQGLGALINTTVFLAAMALIAPETPALIGSLSALGSAVAMVWNYMVISWFVQSAKTPPR